MGEKNIFETIGETRTRQRVEAGKRLEIAVELDKLLKQMEKETDSDSRASIEGQIRELLARGRRILEEEDVKDYYAQLENLKRSAA